jgi:hypothetical protein
MRLEPAALALGCALVIFALGWIIGWIMGDTHGCDKTNREWLDEKNADWKRFTIVKKPEG